jgi:predicted secreted protein
MKKIVFLSHCIMNPFCELPEAPDRLRKSILEIFTQKGWGIVQLPCPELCYQGLDRVSIYPGTLSSQPYERYCEQLLGPLFNNIKEYKEYNIQVGGIVGIDTSPSCSVCDRDAIMIKGLRKWLEEMDISGVYTTDMPIEDKVNAKSFLDTLKSWV